MEHKSQTLQLQDKTLRVSHDPSLTFQSTVKSVHDTYMSYQINCLIDQVKWQQIIEVRSYAAISILIIQAIQRSNKKSHKSKKMHESRLLNLHNNMFMETKDCILGTR